MQTHRHVTIAVIVVGEKDLSQLLLDIEGGNQPVRD
jgi:hypothetical protein